MPDRGELLRAVQAAHTKGSGADIAQAAAALEEHDAQTAHQAAAERETDLGARIASRALSPVPLHETHTAATDWLGDVPDPDAGQYRTAMTAEATLWMRQLDPAVLADRDEFAAQAHGRALTLASSYGSLAPEAGRAFLENVGWLARHTAASGLPQIDQLIDPNNQPSPTPYPAAPGDQNQGTFDNFAPWQNEYNGGVEGQDHDSQASSQQAPMLQQVNQQNSSGSGFGSGPERPDMHDTRFDTSNSYAEVPLGPPGQIPTAPAATDSAQTGSAPNPVAGTQQDAGADRRRTTSLRREAMRISESSLNGQPPAGYSRHDHDGFAWRTAALAGDDTRIPHHAPCGSFHWPTGQCAQGMAHTASAAVDHSMNLDQFTRHSHFEAEGSRYAQGVIRLTEGDFRRIASHHDQQIAAFRARADGNPEEIAWLNGYLATIRPVLAEGPKVPPDFPGAAGPDHGHPQPRVGASSLPQVQEVVDPNNTPDPQNDQLPAEVAFPLNPAFTQQWQTGPQGAQPHAQKQAAGMKGLPTKAAEMFGGMDSLEGKDARHRNDWAFSAKAHGKYLRAWNTNQAFINTSKGASPLSREDYAKMTGRPDLYSHYVDMHDQSRRMRAQGSLPSRTADTLTKPHQTTDDTNQPFSSPQTTPQPFSQNESAGGQGFQDGVSDAQAGESPTFMDNSSHVSPYVSQYAQGYSSVGLTPGAQPAQPDVPRSMGGDSGQAQNAQEAQRAFLVSKGFRVSAAFVPRETITDPEFMKGYSYARKWNPGQRLCSIGSGAFEAGLYAGASDNPGYQAAWVAAHQRQAQKFPKLAQRLRLHKGFTGKYADANPDVLVRGHYVQAATTTDLITDGPGTSPDPMGATPVNGPGQPPPMGGLSDPAQPGGPGPYQGADPMPQGPAVPDDVMGQPQEPPQPDGPIGQGYSGPGPGYTNQNLAPRGPNTANGNGYSNPDAYQGSPQGGDRVATLVRTSARALAFRSQAQARLELLRGAQAR